MFHTPDHFTATLLRDYHVQTALATYQHSQKLADKAKDNLSYAVAEVHDAELGLALAVLHAQEQEQRSMNLIREVLDRVTERRGFASVEKVAA